jgi:hypothetical protein
LRKAKFGGYIRKQNKKKRAAPKDQSSNSNYDNKTPRNIKLAAAAVAVADTTKGGVVRNVFAAPHNQSPLKALPKEPKEAPLCSVLKEREEM